MTWVEGSEQNGSVDGAVPVAEKGGGIGSIVVGGGAGGRTTYIM